MMKMKILNPLEICALRIISGGLLLAFHSASFLLPGDESGLTVNGFRAVAPVKRRHEDVFPGGQNQILGNGNPIVLGIDLFRRTSGFGFNGIPNQLNPPISVVLPVVNHDQKVTMLGEPDNGPWKYDPHFLGCR